MHRSVGAKALRFVLLVSFVLAFLPLEAGVNKGIAAQEPEADPYLYYFPIGFRDATIAPDLVVEAITVNADSAVVVIKNQGTAEIELENSFWVDLYIDPDPIPSQPNQVWDRVSIQGLVWGVGSSALPLGVGETLTLTHCPEREEPDPYIVDEYSHFDTLLARGTLIAVQVDSADESNAYGAVKEGHEVLGTSYNNVSIALSIDGFGCGEAPEAPPVGLLPLVQSDRLPPRPHYTE